MKFIKLEMLNLASLDRPDGETIYFEEGALGDSNIFSIVGPTGSGKSTILDAICLALYNRAPRYPRRKGERKRVFEIFGEQEEGEKYRLGSNDPRNILTRGKKRGYSKLTFRANNDAVYRAEWSVCKKTRNYDEAVTSLFRITVKDGVPVEEQDEWDKLPQIIGLDYDQFLRTVLIAQGSFSTFIKATTDERYELLEKLIGCEDLYADIAARIRQEKDRTVTEYNRLTARFAAQEKDLIPEEELAAVKTRIAELEAEDKLAKDELLKVTASIAWYTADRNFRANIEKYRSAFDEAKRELDAMQGPAARLALHDATLPAVGMYKDMKTAEAKIAVCDRTLQSLGQTIAEMEKNMADKEEKELEGLKRKALEASDRLEQQKPHINKAREIKAKLEEQKDVAAERKAARAEAEKAKERADKDLSVNEEAIRKAGSDLQKAQEVLTALQAEIRERKDILKRKADEARAAYAGENARLEGFDAARLQEARTCAEKAQTDLQAAIRIHEDLKAKHGQRDGALGEYGRLTERNAVIAEALKGFDLDKLDKELDTLGKSYTLMTSERWEQHRAALAEGEPCPLCGSAAHPYHDVGVIAPVIDRMKKLIDEKRMELDRQRDTKNRLVSEQDVNNGQLKGIGTTLRNLDADIAGLNDRWKDLQKVHADWPADTEALEALRRETAGMVEETGRRLEGYHRLFQYVNQLRKDAETIENERQEYEKASAERTLAAEKEVTDAKILLETEKAKTDNLKARQAEKAEAFKRADDLLAKAEQDVRSKLEALKQEIGDKDPDSCEKELEEARNAAVEAVKDKAEEIADLRERLKEMKGMEEATKTQKKDEKALSDRRKAELSAWLADYDADKDGTFTEEEVALLYAATDDWEGIRGRLHRLTQEYTSSKTTLDNETKAHADHHRKKPDRPEEELTARKAELESRSNAELIDARARLQRHESAREQLGDMLGHKQEAESLKREWEEIDEAIGSDGKRLRKIAQCYTLRFLIEHANAEIRKFNSRYELMQVKNSLGIRVIDHDRADDIRDTTTLSGGETFIVSLGLALGLAALSSRNIGFQNLFIDEGFGTLDPDTLETVIDSLSMLQTSQGKKVGVISHTEAMSERITTQIRVIKNGNSGSSRIEIHP